MHGAIPQETLDSESEYSDGVPAVDKKQHFVTQQT